MPIFESLQSSLGIASRLVGSKEAFDDWEPFEDTPGTMAMVAADWMLPQLETGEVEREAEWFFEDTQGTVATVAADWMLPQLETREVEEAELYEDCPICDLVCPNVFTSSVFGANRRRPYGQCEACEDVSILDSFFE